MPIEKSHHHRPTGLKQTNKAFKSKHASKGLLKDRSKGKVNRVAPKNPVPKGRTTKADRRNAAKLLQQKKREELVRSNRLFEGRHGAPKIVAVVPLCPDVDAEAAISHLYSSIGEDLPTRAGLSVLDADRFKQKIQFVPLRRNFIDVIDAFKVADFAILLMSAEVEVDKFGLLCLSAIQHQGLVSVVPVVQHLEKVTQKLRPSVRKSLVSFTKQFFPEEDKLLAIDNEADAVNILRHISEQRPKPLAWRDQHPYLVAESVTFRPNDATEGSTGTLEVTGYARGLPFNANRLVHLQNFGDFQVKQIISAPLPHAAVATSEMQEDARVLDTPDPAYQDDLVAENEPDLMQNEQTWPTEEEMAEADEHVRTLRRDSDASIPPIIASFTTKLAAKTTKRVPKGTSSYQASWIVDDASEDEYTDEDEEMEADEDVEVDAEEGQGNASRDEEFEDVEEESRTEETAEQLGDEEEEKQLQAYLSRQKEHRDDAEFPDEVDTPLNVPARTRFARYRGLQSFRTSPWDPYENLPIDYARIFQFENYKRTRARVVAQAIGGAVKPGSHITIHVANVPKEVLATYDPSRPFVVFGLLQYEHKMSVLNFAVTRNSEYTAPVKSKDPLILHVGFRRFVVRPLFSQNTRGGKGTNNVHKFERFLQQGRTSIATVFGPVQFGNLPCLLFKETADVNAPELVATGAFHDADPKRIVAKRIVLTGHPFKINKRSAVIRYMFFNPEDVMWFKPVQLATKYGRTGHIRESLGTHGYMKCIFDGPVTQQDTVTMNLYKRVFPKWNTELWKCGVDPHGDGVRRGVIVVGEGEMEL